MEPNREIDHQMPSVKCVGRDGVTRELEFQWQFDELDRVWRFFVYKVPRPPSGEIFDMTFTPISDTTVRQTSIAHHSEPAYVGMGIPDAMLPLVKTIIGKEIESSPPDGVVAGMFRSPDAEKMWRRLRENGIAEYIEERRVYRVL